MVDSAPRFLFCMETAAHVAEPKYPAVMEQYINLGQFYDTESVRRRKEEVVALNRRYKALYAKAYDAILAAADICRERCVFAAEHGAPETIRKRAKGIISREIKKQNKTGKTIYRYLSALTCKGSICYFDTVASQCSRVYVLDNEFGTADQLLRPIGDAALAAGCDVVFCPDPMDDSQLAHLIIPELSLAFVSQTRRMRYPGPTAKHVRLDALINRDALRANKARLKTVEKTYDAYIDHAQSVLASAKSLHDALERVYNPYVDFEGVHALAASHGAQLLQMIP